MLKTLAIISLLFTFGVLLTGEYACAKNSRPFAFSIDDTDVKIVMPSCRKTTGSVKGLKVINPDGKQFTYSWKNAGGTEVSTDLDLIFKGDGVYTLTVTATDGSGKQIYGPVRFISTPGVTIDSTNAIITPSTCGQATGGITGVTATGVGVLRYSWTDASGTLVGNQQNISGLAPGTYLLGVVSEDGYCGASYGPIIIPNNGGPVIDETAVEVFNTDCQNSNGHVIGIKVTGTGTLRYEWLDVDNNIVGTNLDLLQRKVGSYRLQVFDQGGCGPSFSKAYSINAMFGSYKLLQTDVKIKPTTCDELGSVTGLRTTSPVIWRWTDEEGNIVSETSELLNAKGGRYLLVVTTNCLDPNTGLRTAIRYNLGPKKVTLPDFTSVIKGTCVGSANGSITVNGNNQVMAYKWFDANNQLVGNSNPLKDMAGGTYSLMLIDTMGCEKLYKTYTIPSSTGAQIVTTAKKTLNDECFTSVGSITGIKGTSGIAPYTFKWLNADGSTASDNADLINAMAATYTLQVFDASGCNPATQTFTIANNDFFEKPILTSDIKICYPTPVSFNVKNPKPNCVYRLYNSIDANTPIDEQASGSFTITPTETNTYYVSRAGGSCESERASIKINVALNSLKIANTFSPNNDGINDTWSLQGMESNTTAVIRVFNRDGGQVFQSKGYTKPFNGTYNGVTLPSGTYFYIIDFNGECKSVSGSITIIR